METLFYALGGSLVLLALAISFIGLRSEDFPSTGMLRAGVALMALIVLATAYGAVGSAQDEQMAREAEENEAASLEEEIATADNEASSELPAEGEEAPGPRDEDQPGGSGGGETVAAAGDPEAGAAVFAERGCGSCHTLQAGGSSAVGMIGPNLDEALVERDPTYIETSIIDPGAVIAEGFSDEIMPVDYSDVIPPDDLANLVAYLSESTSGSSK